MTKGDRELKQKLSGYRIPEADAGKKETARKKWQEEAVVGKMTDLQFIIGQIGFIKLHTWFDQVLVLLCMGAVFQYFSEMCDTNYRLFSMLSAMTPFFLVFQIEELARVFYKSTLEIEYATKYSLKKLVLSRLFILGNMDLVIMGGWIVFLSIYLKESLYAILLYSLLPFNMTVIGMLYLLKYVRKGNYEYQALIYTAFVCTLFFVVPRYYHAIYAVRYQGVWLAVLLLSVVLLYKTAKEVWKGMGCYEKILMAGEM